MATPPAHFPVPSPNPVTGAQPSPHPVLREHVAAWGKIMSLPHFPSLEEALVDWGGNWSSLPDQACVICSKSPSFIDKDRKGDKLTLKAHSTLQDPWLETDGNDPKYFWKNECSGKTQIGNFSYIWKLEDNMRMLFLD